MSDFPSRARRGFGKRKALHQVTITTGERTRTFTVRPWLAAGSCLTLGLFITGYMAAAAYFVMRDDLIENRLTQRTQEAAVYENRIAYLRAEIDRLTSSQMYERRSVEGMIDTLLQRQNELLDQHGKVAALLDKAARSGLDVVSGPAIPTAKPEQLSDTGTSSSLLAIGGPEAPLENPFAALGLRGSSENGLLDSPLSAYAPPPASQDSLTAKPLPKLEAPRDDLLGIGAALDRISEESNAALDAVTLAAEHETSQLAAAVRPLGYRVSDLAGSMEATGGPYVPLAAATLDDKIERAESALDLRNKVRQSIGTIPLARPIAAAQITSDFGPRIDPFLGGLAMHTGIDFRAPYGTPVRATAPGTVITASYQGGYGRLVEVEHPDGHLTRYAHMSAITVAVGDEVRAGDQVGRLGNTGRSTGPHLHYEVRRDDEALDPMTFVRTGDKVSKLLKR
ncbi:M23 family metallopeptidase [Pannonibacter sp. Pt2]|uniref:M23 family metallopeptidase n=1 Tax=Pannonibacter anstelovis TaxID=3121537 RepID=A0ABU7ZKR0_9HYPH